MLHDMVFGFSLQMKCFDSSGPEEGGEVAETLTELADFSLPAGKYPYCQQESFIILCPS